MLSKRLTTQLSAGGLLAIIALIAALLFLPDKPGTDNSPLPPWLKIYFTDPNPPDNTHNAVDQFIIPLIDGATRSIDVASFDLNLPSVIDALIRARQRGVDVRVVYDGQNGTTVLDADRSPTGKEYNAISALKSGGISLVDGGRTNGFMHNKMLIIDGKTLVTGSWNLSYNDTYRNNNNLLVITDPTLILNYQSKFNEMFVEKRFGTQAQVGAQVSVFGIGDISIANYFSPRDKVMEKLTLLVGNARKSIYFMAFYYSHPDLVNVMVERYRAGLDVQGIFESRSSALGAMAPLYCAGIPVKVDGNRYTMHHKVIIIDEHIVVTGSFNFTKSADDSNDDNLLIIDNAAVAQVYLQEYQRMLTIARQPDVNDPDFNLSIHDPKWSAYCK